MLLNNISLYFKFYKRDMQAYMTFCCLFCLCIFPGMQLDSSIIQKVCIVWHFLFPSLSNNCQQVQIHVSSGKKNKFQYVWFHIWKIGFMQHRLQDFPVSHVTYFPLSVAQWLESLPKMWSIRKTKWKVLWKQTEVKADRSVTLGGQYNGEN